ncbi:hypothetical protein WBQ88_02530 [Sphingopyxis sp. CCNWLW253]|uniref:hypothetical protein n=1 Tax=unclassified Sphingopyxis TaxID=2614943 RepID=UPI003012CB19
MTIDDRQTDYDFASVALFPTVLKIDRVEQGVLDHWFIRDPGPHFLLRVTPDMLLSALKDSSFEHCESGHDLGQMYWYGGAAGRDGTGSRSVSNLNVAFETSPDRERLKLGVCGSLIDREQIISGALPPPQHLRFQLLMSFPLNDLHELSEYCPEHRASISEALAPR